MGTPSGRILLYDPVHHELTVAAAINSNTPVGSRMRIGEGVAGRVALTRQPLIINDYATWEGHVPYHSVASLHAVIGIPMVYGGELIGVLTVTETSSPSRQFSDRDARLLSLFATQAASAVHNARLFQQTNNRAEQLALLYDAGLTLNRMLDPHAVMRFLLTIAAKTVRGDRVDFFRYDSRRQMLYFEAGSGYTQEAVVSSLRATPMPLGEDRGLVGRVALERVPLYLPDVRTEPHWIPFDPLIRSALLAPVVREDELRGVLTISSTREDAFSPADQRLVALFANQLSVAMENARLFEQTRRRAEQLAVVNRIAEAVNRTMTLSSLLELIYKEISASLRFEAFFIALYDARTDEVDFRIRVDQGTREAPLRVPRQSATLTSVVIETRQPVLIRDWEQESARFPAPALFGTMLIPSSFLGVPMKIGDAVVGVIAVQAYTPNAYSEEDEQLLTTIADQIAVAIEKARLFEAERRRRHELTALYDLSRALTDEQDFDSILNLVVRHSVRITHVSYARIALVEGDEMVVHAGFPGGTLECDLQLGRRDPITAHPLCLNAMQKSVPVVIRADDPALTEQERQACFLGDAQDLCVVPLRAGDRNFGVLMLGQSRHENRDPFSPEKLHLAFSIGDQAASALARALLREQSNRAAAELASAYDATIEGWARALEMRDREARGHTQRVSELALYIARALQVPDSELTHIRRGALLHDIGKMAIPDSILFKRDPLSPEEEKIMRQHPESAYALLYPIAYLRPALDIPYCHHEKWDGTGYPRGLKEAQIPLAARIFAIADVWDAMRSERLYRPAWNEEAALEYVKAQAGKHFDPEIVKMFLDTRAFAFYRTLS
jgi:putative nucleotidyltransferase with HDIG domain